MRTVLIAAAAAILTAGPAAAVNVASIATAGANTATVAVADPGQLGIDFALNDQAPIVVALSTVEGDAAGIAFNSVIDSFFGTGSGQVLTTLDLALSEGASFSVLGSVVPAFSTATFDLSNGGRLLSIDFGVSGESFGLQLGDIDGFGDDFVISTTAAAFTLTLTPGAAFAPVPEPATWALMIGGFGLVGASLRRRGVARVAA